MKKLSATKQILNFLDAKGGNTTKNIIAELKLPPANIYAGLAYLRKNKHITRDAGGVYHAKTRLMPLHNEKKATPVSKVTNKGGWKAVSVSTSNKPVPIKTQYIKSLEGQVHGLEKFCAEWRQNYKKLEADYTQAKIMYLNSQAVVAYLEEKVAQLIKG
jgi:hypothetical protein